MKTLNELLKDNPLASRDDTRQSLVDLLSPLREHVVPGANERHNSTASAVLDESAYFR
jgi:hypothetical protein